MRTALIRWAAAEKEEKGGVSLESEGGVMGLRWRLCSDA